MGWHFVARIGLAAVRDFPGWSRVAKSLARRKSASGFRAWGFSVLGLGFRVFGDSWLTLKDLQCRDLIV